VSVRKGAVTNYTLQSLRKNNGFTQKQLAELVGTSLSQYQYIESGIKDTTVSKAIKMARVLGTDVESIFTLSV